MSDTYLLVNGQQSGPFSDEQIVSYLTSGSISHETAAWREGLSDWVALGALYQPAPQPPLPPIPVLPQRPISVVRPLPPLPVLSTQESQKVKTGGNSLLIAAAIGCCLSTCLLSYSPSLFFAYWPLWMAALVLSIVATFKGRHGAGLALMAATLLLLAVALYLTNPSANHEAKTHDVAASVPEVPTNTTAAPSLPTPPTSLSPFPNLDAANGIGGFQLGEGISQISMDRLKPEPGWYTPHEDFYAVQNLPDPLRSDHVTLTFSLALLTRISIIAPSRTDSLALKDFLTKTYGNPVTDKFDPPFEVETTYDWKGLNCHLFFKIDRNGVGDAELSNESSFEGQIGDVLSGHDNRSIYPGADFTNAPPASVSSQSVPVNAVPQSAPAPTPPSPVNADPPEKVKEAEALYAKLKSLNPDSPQLPDEDLAPHTIAYQVDMEEPGRVVDLYMPKTVWDRLTKKQQDLMAVFARSRVDEVKANPGPFSLYPPESPLYPADCAAIQQLTPASWEISVGHMDDEHYLDIDDKVVKGWDASTPVNRSLPDVVYANASSDPVYNNPLDASVAQVKAYLAKTLNDADSVEYVEWTKVIKTGLGYQVRVSYRAKNGFGAFVLKDETYALDKQGKVTRVTDDQ